MTPQINPTAASTRSIRILLVEDNPGDARLAREALKDGKLVNEMHHVVDGVEAIDFLRNQGAYLRAPRPDLILLDLNLPRKDGREVLAEVKADADLRTIPVVVLTTSESDQDILRSYDLQANCYISKPVDFDKFVEVVRAIGDFWFTVVRLPSAE